MSAGANVEAVQRTLGRASAAMTLDVYADLCDEDLQAVSEALDSFRSAAVVGFSLGLSTARVPKRGVKPEIPGRKGPRSWCPRWDSNPYPRLEVHILAAEIRATTGFFNHRNWPGITRSPATCAVFVQSCRVPPRLADPTDPRQSVAGMLK